MTRRGLVLSAGAVGMALLANVAEAAPAALVVATVKAASQFAAGRAATGLISIRVASLTEGMLKAMFVNKLLKTGAVVLLLLGTAALTGVMLAGAPKPPTQPVPADPPVAPARLRRRSRRGRCASWSSTHRASRCRARTSIPASGPKKRASSPTTITKPTTLAPSRWTCRKPLPSFGCGPANHSSRFSRIGNRMNWRAERASRPTTPSGWNPPSPPAAGLWTKRESRLPGQSPGHVGQRRPFRRSKPAHGDGRMGYDPWLAKGGDAATTDADGRWRIDNVPNSPQAELSLMISHPDYVSDEFWQQARPAATSRPQRRSGGGSRCRRRARTGNGPRRRADQGCARGGGR